MFGQKLKTLEALVRHYEDLFASAGFDPSKSADGDTDALENFIEGRLKGADASGIHEALTGAGIEIDKDASAEQIGEAVAEAIGEAKTEGESEAERKHAAALAKAGVKVAPGADAKAVSDAIAKKVSGDMAAKVASAGLERGLEQKPGDDIPDDDSREGLEAAIAGDDPKKREDAWKKYSEKYLPALR